MAAVIAEPAPAGDAVPLKPSRKKLLVFGAIGVAVAVLLAAGGGGVWYLKKRAADAVAEALAEDGVAEDTAVASPTHADPKNPPTYVPLDPFVVNLADKDVDRYAQIGITLEVENAVFADRMKGYMPAVRNAILLVLAHKSARDLLGRSGKEELAEEIRREAVRPMGIEIASPEPVTAAAPAAASAAPVVVVAAAAASSEAASGLARTGDDEVAGKAKKPARKRGETVRNPVVHVHFSSFIIQ